MVVERRLRVLDGQTVPRPPVAVDPKVFQAACVDAFVASWTARGFSPVTIDNDTALLEWGTVFPDPRLVAAIVDRVTFNAHILETGTQSHRLRTSRRNSRPKRSSS